MILSLCDESLIDPYDLPLAPNICLTVFLFEVIEEDVSAESVPVDQSTLVDNLIRNKIKRMLLSC